jgi:hypothetical protein
MMTCQYSKVVIDYFVLIPGFPIVLTQLQLADLHIFVLLYQDFDIK